jgi:hypothetical protein
MKFINLKIEFDLIENIPSSELKVERVNSDDSEYFHIHS